MTLLVRVNDNRQCKFKDESGNAFTNPHDISNQFNDFFVNVGPELASNIQNTGKNYYDYLHEMKSSSMYVKPIIEQDIIKIIDKGPLTVSKKISPCTTEGTS